jgi:hypothetical protein
VAGGRLFPPRAELGRNWLNLIRSSMIGALVRQHATSAAF